jgi:hypothetical protein
LSKILTLLLLPLIILQACEQSQIKHITVYFEKGRFAGWPANYGIWSWGNEILVGFSRGYHKDLGPERHNIDREKPEEHLFARSLDGGETWKIEDPSEAGVLLARGTALHGIEPRYPQKKEATVLTEPINFRHPDFVMTLRMLDIDHGPSLFHTSYDRGKHWNGPYQLKVGDMTKIAARTDYIVNDSADCSVFLTAAKSNDQEGRPFYGRTMNGGITWDFVSWIGQEPKGFAIMPSSVRLSDTVLLVALRCREGSRRWIESYRSDDNGQTWDFLNIPVENTGEGNPPALIKLRDGRLCLTYGFRAEPYSIQAKISSDNGKSWGPPIMLRADGSGRDIGYTRSVQRPDGKIVTLYYFQNHKASERFIAATIWDPDVE